MASSLRKGRGDATSCVLGISLVDSLEAAMCQDRGEAESDEVCVNVHEHVSVYGAYTVCLHASFVYVSSVCVYWSLIFIWSLTWLWNVTAGREKEEGKEGCNRSNWVYTEKRKKVIHKAVNKLQASKNSARPGVSIHGLGVKFHGHENRERPCKTAAWNLGWWVNYSWYYALTCGVK